MEGTVDSRRFSWLVFFFVFSMFLLVFSGNFFLTMVGWDGLGLVSFCLVIFYSNSVRLESGLVTVFSNRVGDVFFLLSFLFFFINGSFTWDFCSFGLAYMFVIFIFFGAITKRAQVPFSAWLPAAIAAPTPVSSLVHSSTLVTAGVYVLIRYNYVFSFFINNFLKVFFLFTMLMAGGCALVERDLKKIVAISTLSQLGMIIFIISVGAWLLSFLHMVIHAFFKRMLFLRTGSLIGQMAGLQDSRFWGNRSFCYGSFIFFVVSCLCLSGFPFFLGFYSKDFIIFSCSFSLGIFMYFAFLIGCFFTVMYSFRLIFNVYFLMYKYISYYNFSENMKFFIFVIMLFLKCWVLGGLFYWVFLSEMNIFFSFFDLVVGIVLFLGGLLTFFMLKFLYSFIFRFCFILFLRWKRSRGTSFFFNYLGHVRFEGTWIEVFGGSGIYTMIFNFNKYINTLSGISIGIILVVFVLRSFYLVYF